MITHCRFFKFTCTLCNGKEEEIIQRLELGVVDALHLVILNLILSKNQKFHDIETSIIPLIKKKLKYLTDNGTNAHVKLSMITSDHIIKILSNNKTRFKCGSETGQQSGFWGLRRMVAPWLPSKYLLYRPKYCQVSSSLKRLKETLIQPNNKKGQFHGKKPLPGRSLGKPALKNVMNVVSKKSSLKRGRPKDLTHDFSDSDTSSFGTLDLLIKPPKDFSGANNPFRLSSDSKRSSGSISDPSSSSTPAGSESGSSIKMFLTPGDKESPLSSGTPSQHPGEGKFHQSKLFGVLQMFLFQSAEKSCWSLLQKGSRRALKGLVIAPRTPRTPSPRRTGSGLWCSRSPA